MLVLYDKPNALTAYLTNEQVLSLGKVGAGNYANGVRFMPGINEIPAEVWKIVGTLPKIQRLAAEDGKIRVVFNEDGSDEKPVLAKIKAEEVGKVIEKTYNHKLLRMWLQRETRHKVAGLINAQIDKIIKQTTKPKNEDEDAA